MKNLNAMGTLYLEKMDLNDVALLKLCAGSLGVMIGLCAAKHHKKSVGILAGSIFACTYVPLMGKLLRVLMETED